MSFRLCSACKHDCCCTYPHRESINQCEEFELGCFTEIQQDPEGTASVGEQEKMSCSYAGSREVVPAA